MLVGRGAAEATDQSRAWRHGVSLFGELKYPAGFERFDYVNPDPPKLGLTPRGLGEVHPIERCARLNVDFSIVRTALELAGRSRDVPCRARRDRTARGENPHFGALDAPNPRP